VSLGVRLHPPMNSDDSYRAAPPPGAYSRVTDRGRFQPLHALALDLLVRLDADYDVSRGEAFDLLPDMHAFEHARPPVSLSPLTPAAAPIAVAFTTFPSLVLRCGRWLAESFPSCGCDACRETADSEGERLRAVLRDVVAGSFWEELKIPLFGDARLSWALGDASDPRSQSRSAFRVLSRGYARALTRGRRCAVQWQPWPSRPRPAATGAPTV
jgi:hypothetical protein